MPFHTSGISAHQLEIIKKSGPKLGKWGFYLAGGTAVSIYFGHRESMDLDWFTAAQLSDPMQFAQILRDEGIAFITTTTGHATLHGTLEGIRFSFFEYHYPLLQPLIFWDEGGCSLASLDDLACMKLSAVAQRGSRKDFIDVFILAKEYKPLPELLSLYQEKYQTDNWMPVLMGLAYFDDADYEPDPSQWSTNWDEVKRQITDWVRKI